MTLFLGVTAGTHVLSQGFLRSADIPFSSQSETTEPSQVCGGKRGNPPLDYCLAGRETNPRGTTPSGSFTTVTGLRLRGQRRVLEPS